MSDSKQAQQRSLSPEIQQPHLGIISTGVGKADPKGQSELRKPVKSLAIVPQSKRITPLFRKSYNVMLFLAQEQGIDRDIYRAPVAAVLSGLDFDSNDTSLVKKHLRAMATTAVEWQSPTTGEGSDWAISGLIGHAEIKRERGQNWLEWSYSVKLKKELLEPSVFARMSIEIMTQLRSHAGIALYEICSRYQDIGRTSRQHWHWWRPVLSGKPETDSQKKLEYRFFKRDILKLAIAEVNSITGLQIELIEFKDGRFVTELQFEIKKKKNREKIQKLIAKPVDMTLVVMGKKLGLTEERAEQLLDDFGEKNFEIALRLLEKRLVTAFPEPLRDPYRYVKFILESQKSIPANAETLETPSATNVFNQQDILRKRKDHWTDEWIRRRRLKIAADISALSEPEQKEITLRLLSDMEKRGAHPSIRKRLQQSGWTHTLVKHEMIKFYAVATIGDEWDKPTATDLLAIAAEQSGQAS